MKRKEDESIETRIRKLRLSPSKKAKEASFSTMRKGLIEMKHEQGDSDETSNRKNRQRWNARLAFIAAAAILFLLLMNLDFLSPADDNQANEQSETVAGVNQNNEQSMNTNDENDAEENEDGEADSLPDEEERDEAEARPPVKAITTYPEGGERTRDYQLLDEEDLPFTTYVREEWTVNHHETDSTGVDLLPAEGEYDFGAITVRVGHDSSYEERFSNEMADYLTDFTEVEAYEPEEGMPFYDWLEEGYRYLDLQEDIAGHSYLLYAEGIWIWIDSSHRIEFQEGWFDDDIFSRELQWR